MLRILTPEKTLIEDLPVKEAVVPSVRGFLGILPGHAPMISLLSVGILKYLPKSGQWEKLAIGWGCLEVSQDRISILAESLEVPQNVDPARVEKKLKTLLAQLQNFDLKPSKRKELQKQKQELESHLALVRS